MDVTMRVNPELAEKYKRLGFPDTEEKFNKFTEIRNKKLKNRPNIIVCDDIHFLKDPEVLMFMEKIIAGLSPNLTIILISRNIPEIDIKSFMMKGLVSEINERDLNFTESELFDCFKLQGLNLDSQTMREIHKDTGGWVFAINLATRSLKKVPMYSGFVKTTLKQNLYKLMEAENWGALSGRLKRFLVQLSLIDRISAELTDILAGNETDLPNELKQQSAYIRFDSYGGAYLFHPIYFNFLKSKQDILSHEEKCETYKTAADWCRQNNFTADALNYYEKMSDYESIVPILWELCTHMSAEIATYAVGIFERAPTDVFTKVDFLAVTHLVSLLCLYRPKEFVPLAESYEKKLLALPNDDKIKHHTLGGLYYVWGCMRYFISTMDDNYDFDLYMEKAAALFEKSPAKYKFHIPVGSWASAVGTAKDGAPQEFLSAIGNANKFTSICFDADTSGFDLLCQGEHKFYRNDIRAAEPLFFQAIESARKCKHFDVLQRALFYTLRVAIVQGDRKKTEQTLRDLKSLLDEENYVRRFITYDITIGWYHCIIRQQDEISDWLKTEFAPYAHANFIENFGAHINANYFYLKRNFMPLMAYIRESKQRESILYGRVEMFAMEACAHYQMKNKAQAWAAFKEAYETAAPNGIVMPFIELGKDMRTLASSALREQHTDASIENIPREWLESIGRSATSYAKNQSMLITLNQQTNSNNTKALSAREHDILSDLYHGFSQSEIADKRSLSVNTVKMVTKSIYDKLHVHKISDLVRIVAEQNLV
jgi:LuxR family maltose regulon positive regulatory protein